METSKPWSTTIALGQRILKELELDQDSDTLARWLAHYLAEKMECAVSAPEGTAGDADRRECVDLILRLWETRQKWPISTPLKDIAERLDELLQPTSHFFHSADPFLDLFRSLEKLHHRETRVCLIAWVAGLDLSKEREFLNHHPEHLDEHELGVTQRLVELQDTVLGPEAYIDDEPCSNFATLPKIEQGKIIRTRLRSIAKERTQLLGRK